MKNKAPITPTEAGLCLAVLSGPRGAVLNDWPCIEYTAQLSGERGKPFWTGDYRLGVGHVKWPKDCESYPLGMTQDETYALNTIRMNPGAQLKNKQLWADTAAKLAQAQKVSLSLDTVCASLLMDGAAFFDGQRFEEWAGDVGLSADSIAAKQTFEVCDNIGRAFSGQLSRDEIEGLREWASNQ